MATASAGRPDKDSSRDSRAFRAPLQHGRLAVNGRGRANRSPRVDRRAPAPKSKERP
jgi:hypothetical protein